MKAPADKDLREAVRKALAADRHTNGLDVRVGVLHSVVHLGGQAPSVALRDRAEAVAAGVPGVRGVANRIEAPGAPKPTRPIDLPLSRDGSGTT